MSDTFVGSDEFDKYVLDLDGWSYDNSWGYKGKGYSCFVRNEHLEPDGHINSLILLIDCPEQFQAIVIHLRNGKQKVVWSGPFRTFADLLAWRHYFEAWNQHNEPPS